MRRSALLGLLVTGIALGLLAEHYSTSDHWWENPWLDLAVGWTYIGAGLVAWWRRPQNRVGPLMTAVGFTWFSGNFTAAPVPLFVSLGTAVQVSGAFLAHLVLAYPDGHLRRRSERVLVATLYVWVLVSGFALALTYDPPRLYGCPCTSGGLAVFPSLNAYDTITGVRDAVTVPFAVAVIVLVVRRYRRASQVARRDLAPLWLAAMLVALAFILEAASGVAANEGALNRSLSEARKVMLLLVPLTFLVGLLRSRLAETTVAQLVRALDRPLQRGALRELLARAVGDPTLRLAFAAPQGDGFVDEDGRRVELPKEGSDTAVTFVNAERGPCAAFVHDRALLERPSLIEAVGAAAGLALEKERLQAEVRAQLDEVRASRARIVEAADAERRRVERDLHDGAQQRLVTLSLALGLAREQAAANSDEALASSLAEASDEAARALNELRELGRGLHPAILTEAGLGPGLEALAERSTVPASVAAAPEQRLPEAVEIGAYFVASEALANVAKHANATHVTLSARYQRGILVLDIEDDGRGGADPAHGSGLTGLEDRVAALGGRLRVDSPVGAGTRIVAEIPCA